MIEHQDNDKSLSRLLNIPVMAFGERKIAEDDFSLVSMRNINKLDVHTYKSLLSQKNNCFRNPKVIIDVEKRLKKLYEEVNKKPFWVLFGLDESSLDDYRFSIFEIKLSVRLHNSLARQGIKTVEDVLLMSPAELNNIKNMGAKSCSELFGILVDVIARIDYYHELIPSSSIFSRNKELVYEGRFDAFNALNLSEKERTHLEYLKEIYETVGPELIDLIKEGDPYFSVIKYILMKLSLVSSRSVTSNQMRRLLSAIDSERLEKKVYGFIDAYTSDDEKKDDLESVVLHLENATLQDFVNVVETSEIAKPKEVLRFLDWCSFSIEEDVKKIEDVFDPNKPERDIVEGRANGETLQVLGDKYGITRERIRQVESKVKRRLHQRISTTNVIMKIYALENQNELLSRALLSDYLGDSVDIITYSLKGQLNNKYYYDDYFDAIIINDEPIAYQARLYIEELPDPISVEDAQVALEVGVTERGLSETLLNKVFQEEYNLSGNIYHRSKLTLKQVYTMTLDKYYSEGIHPYDDDELKLFRERIKNDFGDVKLPDNNRAIAARIADICILSGRGEYRPKKDYYISKKLIDKVIGYVNRTEANIVPMSVLFHVFENELLTEGVDNKYYLQGILREKYGDKFSFRRDYLLKEGADTSFYLEIVNLIRKSDSPVSKEEIIAKFPGVTDIVIILAVNDDSILNYFGSYFHESKLKISDEQVLDMRSLLITELGNDGVVHGRELYRVFEKEFGIILKRNGVYHPFSFFSLLKHLFKDEFIFDRPYIAIKGEKITRPTEKLKEYLKDKDVVDILDVINYCKSIHLQVPNILGKLNSINSTHLIIDGARIATAEYLGINDEIIETVEKEIKNEIERTTPIYALQSAYLFPKIREPWTPWLIYSVLNKYSMALDVDVIGSKFRGGVPVVAKRGRLDLTEVNNIDLAFTEDYSFDIDEEDLNSLVEEMLGDEYEF